MLSSRSLALFCGAVSLAAGAAATTFDILWRDNRAVERIFCRAGLCANDLIQADAASELFEGNPNLAANLYVEAVRREPASAYRWADLADAYFLEGDSKPARIAFEKALDAGPRLPLIAWRAAQFHYAHQELESALDLSARVLGGTAELDTAVFSAFRRFDAPLGLVLERGIPRDERAANAFFLDLLEEAAESDRKASWSWLTSQNLALATTATSYARALSAHEARQALAQFRPHEGAAPVFNGGFEYAPLDCPCDWRASRFEGAAVERDRVVAHSGEWSLRVDFESGFPGGYQHLRQRVAVDPGEWRFEAWARADMGGTAFRLLDAGRFELLMPIMESGQSWRKTEALVRIPKATRSIEIQLIHSSGGGSFWIDDVSLRRP